ncbi:hypothetical protein HNP38_001589 [Chryseobacterium defluvii]|uniref:Uncharacterized protein n=1 Tax=Chryseobacterium defluvii TaxID=160396 RepID=A0A840KEC0_9FLAO|nr:hypothetical protein [Chryseobacterium defluvii]MBB4806317.1 hypothetical protein [Chryseobacterium defluvii]
MAKTLSDSEFNKLIQKHIDKNNFVKIYLSEESPDQSIFGFILKMSDEYLMVQETYDFTLAGIKIIPQERILSIRCNPYDKTQKKILSEEHLLKFDQNIIHHISLRDAGTLFKSLKKQNFHCIVESTKKKKGRFSIGEILEVDDKFVFINNYDPTGKTGKKPHKISLKKIEMVTFNDNYTLIFRKYLK